MAQIVPVHLIDNGRLNLINNDTSLATFARTTRTLARSLLQGAIENVENTGSKQKFNSAYLSYAGVEAVTTGGYNDGGVRSDVLVRSIQSLYSQNVNVNVTVDEKQRLGALRSSGGPAMSDHSMNTIAVSFAPNPNCLFTLKGTPQCLFVEAFPNGVANTNLFFTYTQPTSLIIRSNVPFVHGKIGLAGVAPSTAVHLPASEAGVFYVAVPAGGINFRIFSTTPRAIDVGTDFEMASQGYKRCISLGLLNGVFESLDELIVNKTFNDPTSEGALAILAILLEAFELSERALSKSVRRRF
jgi:VP8 protein